jgi:hypothetical protein
MDDALTNINLKVPASFKKRVKIYAATVDKPMHQVVQDIVTVFLDQADADALKAQQPKKPAKS